MEHRWGERVAVRMTVELSSGSSPPVAGDLENVSSSGAFVRTEGRGPPRGPVEVVLRQDTSGRGRSVRLAAHVVRESESGVGIEWSEFAPRAVRELMIRNRRAGGERARAWATHSVRHPKLEAHTKGLPHTQAAAEPAVIGAIH